MWLLALLRLSRFGWGNPNLSILEPEARSIHLQCCHQRTWSRSGLGSQQVPMFLLSCGCKSFLKDFGLRQHLEVCLGTCLWDEERNGARSFVQLIVIANPIVKMQWSLFGLITVHNYCCEVSVPLLCIFFEQRVHSEQLRPNDVTVCALISSCSRASQWESQPQVDKLQAPALSLFAVAFPRLCTRHVSFICACAFTTLLAQFIGLLDIAELLGLKRLCTLNRMALALFDSNTSQPGLKEFEIWTPRIDIWFPRWDMFGHCTCEDNISLLLLPICGCHLKLNLEVLDIPGCISMERAYIYII